jgi:hypothetical protein
MKTYNIRQRIDNSVIQGIIIIIIVIIMCSSLNIVLNFKQNT